MDTSPDMSHPATDIQHGQGISVGTNNVQINYFINSSESLRPRRRISGPPGSSSLRVFISSASGALAPYRLAAMEICARLDMIPVSMEEFDPERPPPEELSRREIEDCDVFVLLLAHRYGSRPPGQRLSYTEREYQFAVNRSSMPLIAFVVDPAFPWPKPDIDQGTDAEELARFIRRVHEEQTVHRLADLATFSGDLLRMLSTLQRTVLPASRLAGTLEEPPWETWRPTPPEFHAVPPYVGGAPFTGRVEDLDVLDEWGRSTDSMMVVEALGGTGKSALTWMWARERAPTAVNGLTGRLLVELLRGLRVDDAIPAGGARLHLRKTDGTDHATRPG